VNNIEYCRICDMPVFTMEGGCFFITMDDLSGEAPGGALLHEECVVPWLDAVRAVFADVPPDYRGRGFCWLSEPWRRCEVAG
jgi:hypothetical protein